mmetsp:Transcript_29959/g.61636  ORF Transcript_29959/g.61636 Transcript_29959/m.61636 type:complete len:208 (-) Transcript_29959:880-1503(-)
MHPSLPFVTCAVALQRPAPSRDGCLDSGSQVSITPFPEHVLEYEEGEVSVSGIHGKAERAQRIKMGVQTVASDGTPILLEVPGPSILHEKANSVLLAFGPFKRAGYRVHWKEGTDLDPHDGGHVKTPDGKRVNLRFQDDLWYLPVFASPTHVARKPPTVVSRTACTDNPFALLTDVTDEPPSYPVPAYVSQWTHEDIEQAHQSWCHP